MIQTTTVTGGISETLSLTFEDVAPAGFRKNDSFVLQRNDSPDGLLLSYSEIKGETADDSTLFSVTREDGLGGVEDIMSVENSTVPKVKFHEAVVEFDKLAANTIQTNAEALGDGSLAVGSYESSAGFSNSSGLGSVASSSGSSGFAALPLATKAVGEASFAQGDGAVAEGQASVALGLLTETTGHYAFSQGISSKATGLYSVAFNNQTEASGQSSFAIGKNNEASGKESLSTGLRNIASGRASIAGGRDSEASGDFSVAIGDAALATETGSTAIGGGHATAQGAAAIGSSQYSPYAGGNTGITPVAWPTASGVNSTAIGHGAVASGPLSLAIGGVSSSRSNAAVATSYGSMAFMGKADGVFSIAMHGAANAKDSLAMFGTANAERSFAMFGTANGIGSIAMGSSNNIADGMFSGAIGSGIVSRSYCGLTVGTYNEKTIAAASTTRFPSNNDRIFSVGVGNYQADDIGRADGFYVTYRNGTRIRQGLVIERFKTDGAGGYVSTTDVDGDKTPEIETVLDIGTTIDVGTNTSQVLVRNPTTKKLEYVDGQELTGSTGPGNITAAGNDRSVQFNDASNLGGDSNFLYDGTGIDLASNGSSVVLTSNGGNRYKISVKDDGTIVSESV